ncbi:MAG TPA: TIGR01777 family oxidoreductase [Bryobacteraceae bacterium]|nr:TIGR01777 family oxidoreductase [Bryobacteraceae bacterium]
MKITITGASGFIGRRLMKTLVADDHELHVLSRHAGTNLPAGVQLSVWDSTRGQPPEESLRGAGAIIHLAGENVAQRWTDAAKQKIRSSRIDGTRFLVQALSTLSERPQALVCASAIGIYGDRGEEVLTEASAPGSGFLSEVCQDWEKQVDLAEALGIRVVKLRIGVVLGANGGALAKMLPAFRAGVGGRLGSGKQWMSWIHLEDLAELIRYAALNPLRGAVNAVAPNPVTNADFTRALASAVHRPALFPVPGFAVRALFGEMSQVMLASQRVLPRAAEAAGFGFRYPRIEEALRSAIS